MAEVDIALNDERQQYGNLDEASAIARVPRKGMVIWCGDYKQTPGGLRKSEEARAFRRKLMRRPIALRGRHYILPLHMLGHSPSVCVGHVWTQGTALIRLLQESTLHHWAYPPKVLLSSKSHVKKQLVEAGRFFSLRAAVQLLQFCGCLRLNDSHYKLTLSVMRLAQRKTKMVSDLTKQCKSIGAHVRHHYWNKISRAGQLAERDHPVWQLPTSGAMHSERLSFHLLGRLLQLSPCQYWYRGGRRLDKGQVCSGHQEYNRNKMVKLWWNYHFAKCHVLCRHDCLFSATCTNQS